MLMITMQIDHKTFVDSSRLTKTLAIAKRSCYADLGSYCRPWQFNFGLILARFCAQQRSRGHQVLETRMLCENDLPDVINTRSLMMMTMTMMMMMMMMMMIIFLLTLSMVMLVFVSLTFGLHLIPFSVSLSSVYVPVSTFLSICAVPMNATFWINSNFIVIPNVLRFCSTALGIIPKASMSMGITLASTFLLIFANWYLCPVTLCL